MENVLVSTLNKIVQQIHTKFIQRVRHGHDRVTIRVVVVFTTTCANVPITTKVVSLNPIHGEMYLLQHYIIKLVSDL